MNKRHTTLTLLAALGSLGTSLMAQNSTATPVSTKPADSEVVQLEKFEVTDVPIEENIMPTSRPFGSVYGDARSILDTPRNVTIISREQLDAISIQDVRDFSKLTSSSYTTTNFGAPSNPTIRGQYADLFQNGIRRVVTSNGNGLPLIFNSVESVNIIKGPATVVQGASFYVGGAADLITKRPTFDKTKGTVTATYGSFDQRRWSLDYNMPVSEKTAVRFSYSGEDSESYYSDGHKRTQSLYGALVYKPTDTYELFLNSELFYADYVENFGINRVTQDLIDNGRYITGINNNPAGVFAVGVPAGPGSVAAPGDPQNATNIVSGFPTTNRILTGPTVNLDRSSRLLKPGDNSLGKMANLQAIQTWKINPDFDIVNNSYFNYIKRDTLSSYLYSEIVDPAWSIENRTEFRFTADKLMVNTGLAARYQEVKAYNHFFFEPASAWDLTRPHSGIDATRSANFPGFGAFPVPGWPGRFAVAGTVEGDTNDSSLFSVGPYLQNNYKVTDELSLDIGGRVDYIQATSNDPLASALPGFLLPAATYDNDHLLANANGSLTYAIMPTLKAYGTYNYSENYGGAVGNGGGIKPNSGDDDFRQPSVLYEVGIKQSLLNNTLFLGAAAFKQERIATQLDGSTRNFTYQGFEIELNYQPNKNFFTTLSYSYLDAASDRPQFDVGNVAFYDGVGDPSNPASYAPLPDTVRFFQVDNGPGKYRIQGLPRNLWNALATYKFDSGFGVTAGLQVHTDINNNVAGSLVIPAQYSLDLTGFYETKTWFAKLAILNATDEKNWAPPNYVYGNESILAELPIRFEFTLGYKF